MTDHGLCSAGWKAGCRMHCSPKLTTLFPRCGQQWGQAALVPGQLPPTPGLAVLLCPLQELWLAKPCQLQIAPYHGSTQQSYAGTKSQGRLSQALLGSCAIRLYILGA